MSTHPSARIRNTVVTGVHLFSANCVAVDVLLPQANWADWRTIHRSNAALECGLPALLPVLTLQKRELCLHVRL